MGGCPSRGEGGGGKHSVLIKAAELECPEVLDPKCVVTGICLCSVE